MMSSKNSGFSRFFPSRNEEKSSNKTFRYYSIVTGKTLKSDNDVKDHLEKKLPGLQEVHTVQMSDIILVFCPIIRKPETDVIAALEQLNHISDTKPAVLVVLHHTFDPDYVAPDSSRPVNRQNMITVNCLFYEDKGLLGGPKNIESLHHIVRFIKSQTGRTKPEEEMQVDPEDVPALSQKETLKYFTLVTGQTLNTHENVKTYLRQKVSHLEEVYNLDKCNFILVFCPIVSRAGTDIGAALMKLNRLSAIKPAVLVVLHRTFDVEYVVPDSSRAVNRGNTTAVDLLFHENMGLLQCNKNSGSLTRIQDYINSQIPQSNRENKTEKKNKVKYFLAQTENIDSYNGHFLDILDLKRVKTVNECDFILIFWPQDRSDIGEVQRNCTGGSVTKPVVLVDCHNLFLNDVLPVISGAVNIQNTLYRDDTPMQCLERPQFDRQQLDNTMGQGAGVQSQYSDRQENTVKEPESSGNQLKAIEMKPEEKDDQIEQMKMEIQKLKAELAQKNRYLEEKEIPPHEAVRRLELVEFELKNTVRSLEEKKTQLNIVSKLLTEATEQVKINKNYLDFLEKQMQDRNRQIQDMIKLESKYPQNNESL